MSIAFFLTNEWCEPTLHFTTDIGHYIVASISYLKKKIRIRDLKINKILTAPLLKVMGFESSPLDGTIHRVPCTATEKAAKDFLAVENQKDCIGRCPGTIPAGNTTPYPITHLKP